MGGAAEGTAWCEASERAGGALLASRLRTRPLPCDNYLRNFLELRFMARNARSNAAIHSYAPRSGKRENIGGRDPLPRDQVAVRTNHANAVATRHHAPLQKRASTDAQSLARARGRRTARTRARRHVAFRLDARSDSGADARARGRERKRRRGASVFKRHRGASFDFCQIFARGERTDTRGPRCRRSSA